MIHKIIKISQARARYNLHNEITNEDFEWAITFLQYRTFPIQQKIIKKLKYFREYGEELRYYKSQYEKQNVNSAAAFRMLQKWKD